MKKLYEVLEETKTLCSLYETATDYLKEQISNDPEKAEECFKRNIKLWETNREKIQTRKDVYKRLIETSINTYSKPSVFGGRMEGREARLEQFLHDVTDGFDFEKIAQTDETELDDRIRICRAQIVKQSIGKKKEKFVKGLASALVSSAKHIQQFIFDGDDVEFANYYRGQYTATTDALVDPYLVFDKIREFRENVEIHGVGFALSCDFLKEIGLPEYGKPDTHIMDLLPFFTGGVYKNHNKNQEAFGQCLIDIIRVSNTLKIKPYEFDKLLYLIGSGKLIGKELAGNSADRKAELSERLTSVLVKNGYEVPEFKKIANRKKANN